MASNLTLPRLQEVTLKSRHVGLKYASQDPELCCLFRASRKAADLDRRGKAFNRFQIPSDTQVGPQAFDECREVIELLAIRISADLPESVGRCEEFSDGQAATAFWNQIIDLVGDFRGCPGRGDSRSPAREDIVIVPKAYLTRFRRRRCAP